MKYMYSKYIYTCEKYSSAILYAHCRQIWSGRAGFETSAHLINIRLTVAICSGELDISARMICWLSGFIMLGRLCIFVRAVFVSGLSGLVPGLSSCLFKWHTLHNNTMTKCQDAFIRFSVITSDTQFSLPS